MNKLVMVTVGALAVVGRVTAAQAGAPAWCKGASFDPARYDLKDLSAKDPRDVVIAFAKATCAPTPEAEAGRAEIDKARQAWSKRLSMTEDDWADAVAYAKSDSPR